MVDYYASAKPGAECRSHEVAEALSVAIACYAEREAVGVIFNGYLHPEFLMQYVFQVHLFPRWNVGGIVDDAVVAVDYRWYACTDAVDAVGQQPLDKLA